jgi:DNA-binding ferritin-like protein
MAGERFFRNQNVHERVQRLNTLADCVDEVEERVETLEESAAASGGSTGYDPGDLTVYYENGKA